MVRTVPNDHIPPHRVWNYLKIEGEFADEEHDHILQCQDCLQLFILALNSDTFGAVLKQLRCSEIEQVRTA